MAVQIPDLRETDLRMWAEIEAEMSVAAEEHSRAVSVQREEAAGRGEEDAIF